MSKNNIIKCAKCPKPAEPRWRNGEPIVAYKGENNAELCCKCARNICWKCGKKEEYEIVEGKWYNVGRICMFSRFEKDERNPSGGWYVYYCDEHLPRGVEKTVENNLPSQPIKQPTFPLSDQSKKCSHCQNIVYTGDTYSCVPCGTVYCSKNCCEASAPQCKSKLDGQNQFSQNNSKNQGNGEQDKKIERNHTDNQKNENGKNNNLLGKSKFGFCDNCSIEFKEAKGWYYIPVKDSSKKTGLCPRKSLNNFCLNCWKTEEKNYRQISNKNDPVYKVKYREKYDGEDFYYYENNKWIGEKNGKSDPDLEENNTRDNPVLTDSNNTINKTSSSLAKIPNKDELIIILLIQFFKSNNIKQVTLNSKGNLTVEYESNKVNESNNQLTTQNIGSHELTNNQELQEVINYCQKTGKNSLSQQELMSAVNSTSISSENPQDNSGLKKGLALGIGGTLLVLMISILLIRKKTTQKLKYK